VHDLPLITTIAGAFAAAWVCGLITHRIGLSPIVGYLIAGILIGPHTPGFEADIHLAMQLAEVGVILLMFGVGLHFQVKDLIRVRGIAVPGAIGQSVVATLASMGIFMLFGWPLKSGLVLGFAMAVASTVVLLRVLMDNDKLNTAPGHAAVGWLIVEDIFTVIVLVMIPVLGVAPQAATEVSGTATAVAANIWISLGWALLKLALMVVVVLVAGSRIVPWILVRVAKLRSPELFTLTVLVLSIAVATGAASLFGASVALGAFLAGMVVGQSPVSHQAAADVLPMRDAFSVIFFVAVGMLFDPSFLLSHPLMVLAGLAIVMVAKPLAALVIVAVLGYSVRTALTVAIGLAQIGEFSFIVSELARCHGLMPEEGHNVLVACAIASITVNPLLFRMIDPIEQWLRARPGLWKMLNAKAEREVEAINAEAAGRIAAVGAASKDAEKSIAIIVGYGPVGRSVERLLRESGLHTVVIDMNMDTVQALNDDGEKHREAIFGDATRREILEHAGIRHATHLVVTLPHSSNRGPLVTMARQMNPELDILVRARYLRERADLRQAGASAIILEEAEAAVALARAVLSKNGADKKTIDREIEKIRGEFEAA